MTKVGCSNYYCDHQVAEFFIFNLKEEGRRIQGAYCNEHTGYRTTDFTSSRSQDAFERTKLIVYVPGGLTRDESLSLAKIIREMVPYDK